MFLARISIILLVVFSVTLNATEYPQSWWQEVPRDQAQSWEVLPQDAQAGQVVLSKRTELGVFSNLAATPFVFEGVRYASLEGLWQMMKYPEENDLNDPRHAINGWPYSRSQVAQLAMFECKHAGDKANELNKALGIKWVSYNGERFEYKDGGAGSQRHYEIIYQATVEKVMQNPDLKNLLKKTKGLILIPDHKVSSTRQASYRYEEILMDIREKLNQE